MLPSSLFSFLLSLLAILINIISPVLQWQAKHSSTFEESNSEESASTIKNAFFTIQGDYTNNRYTYGDARNGDNIFDYGYVGKFNTYKAPIYDNGIAVDSLTGTIYNGQVLTGWADTLYTFLPGNINQSLVNYTSAYYDMFEENGLKLKKKTQIFNFI